MIKNIKNNQSKIKLNHHLYFNNFQEPIIGLVIKI